MPQIPMFQFKPSGYQDGNVRADVGMYAGERAAAARLGESVAGIGQGLMNLAVAQKQAENYKAKTEAEVALHSAWGEFEAGINPGSDPDKLQTEWQAKAAAVLGEKTKGMTPATLEQTTLMSKAFMADRGGQLARLSASMKIDKAKKTGELLLNQAYDDGDFAKADAVLEDMAKHGLIYREDMALMKEKGQQRAEYQVAFGQLNENPQKAIDLLQDRTEGGKPRNFTKLDESQRYALLQSARGALNSMRADTQNDLWQRRNSGELIPEEELSMLEAKGAVSSSWSKAFRKQQLKDKAGNGGVESAGGKLAELRRQIAAYDPVKDTSMEEYGKLMEAATLLPERMATDAVQRIKEKADPDSHLNGSVAKYGMSLVAEASKAGLYGNPEKHEGYGENRKKVTDPKIYQQMVDTEAKHLDAVAEYVKAHPNATRADVEKLVSGLNARFVTVKARKPIDDYIAGPAPSIRSIDELIEAKQKAMKKE